VSAAGAKGPDSSSLADWDPAYRAQELQLLLEPSDPGVGGSGGGAADIAASPAASDASAHGEGGVAIWRVEQSPRELSYSSGQQQQWQQQAAASPPKRRPAAAAATAASEGVGGSSAAARGNASRAERQPVPAADNVERLHSSWGKLQTHAEPYSPSVAGAGAGGSVSAGGLPRPQGQLMAEPYSLPGSAEPSAEALMYSEQHQQRGVRGSHTVAAAADAEGAASGGAGVVSAARLSERPGHRAAAAATAGSRLRAQHEHHPAELRPLPESPGSDHAAAAAAAAGGSRGSSLLDELGAWEVPSCFDGDEAADAANEDEESCSGGSEQSSGCDAGAAGGSGVAGRGDGQAAVQQRQRLAQQPGDSSRHSGAAGSSSASNRVVGGSKHSVPPRTSSFAAGSRVKNSSGGGSSAAADVRAARASEACSSSSSSRCPGEAASAAAVAPRPGSAGAQRQMGRAAASLSPVADATTGSAAVSPPLGRSSADKLRLRRSSSGGGGAPGAATAAAAAAAAAVRVSIAASGVDLLSPPSTGKTAAGGRARAPVARSAGLKPLPMSNLAGGSSTVVRTSSRRQAGAAAEQSTAAGVGLRWWSELHAGLLDTC
jgi:hypothetical protein